jgi:hypothetical protein
VSFVAPRALSPAESWWRGVMARSAPRGGILVAREGSRIGGTVHLQPAWAPNPPHRADVVMLLVIATIGGGTSGRA